MKWTIAILALLSSLALAGVAAWFSIIGLMAVFAGLPSYAFAMAACIEIAKLTAASWLKINWENTNKALRSALVVFVLVAMFVTSIGIYGLLSKAHIEQGAPVVNNTAQIERIEHRIQREMRTVSEAEDVLRQLQKTVDTLIEYDKISGPDGARAVRESQEPERKTQTDRINLAEDRIDELLDQQAELGAELRAYEVEVGPIKYLAALFTEDPSASDLETAVRYLILLLIFIFDPFAVLLLIAANQSLIELTTRKVKQRNTAKIITSPLDKLDISTNRSPGLSAGENYGVASVPEREILNHPKVKSPSLEKKHSPLKVTNIKKDKK